MRVISQTKCISGKRDTNLGVETRENCLLSPGCGLTVGIDPSTISWYCSKHHRWSHAVATMCLHTTPPYQTEIYNRTTADILGRRFFLAHNIQIVRILYINISEKCIAGQQNGGFVPLVKTPLFSTLIHNYYQSQTLTTSTTNIQYQVWTRLNAWSGTFWNRLV